MIAILIISLIGFVAFYVAILLYSKEHTMYENEATLFSYVVGALFLGVIFVIACFNMHFLLGWIALIVIVANIGLILSK